MIFGKQVDNMSKLHNLQGVVIEMTSQSHQVTQTKHENRQTMDTKATCFCEESFTDSSFLVLEISRGALCAQTLLENGIFETT